MQSRRIPTKPDRLAAAVAFEADGVFDGARAAVAADEGVLERPERFAGLVDLGVGLDRRPGLLRLAQQLLEALAEELLALPPGHAAVGIVHEREHAFEVDLEIAVLEAVDQVAEGVLGFLEPRLDHLARRPSLHADVEAAAPGHDRDGGVELELATALVHGCQVLTDGA